MDLGTEVQVVAAKVRSQAAASLRSEFPYLPSKSLVKILDYVENGINTKLNEDAELMTAAKSRMNFFKLSPELRNSIYEFALIKNKHIKIQDGHGSPPERPPAILRTCRQIRAEALPVYYGQNTFLAVYDWQDPPKMAPAKWLFSLGRKTACLIPQICDRFRMQHWSDEWIDEAYTRHLFRWHTCKLDFVRELGFEGLGISLDAFRIEGQRHCDGPYEEVLEIDDHTPWY